MASSSNPVSTTEKRSSPSLYRFYESKQTYEAREEAKESVRLIVDREMATDTIPCVLQVCFPQYKWDLSVKELRPYEYQVRTPKEWKNWALKKCSIKLGEINCLVFRLEADEEISNTMFYAMLTASPIPYGMRNKEALADLVHSFGDLLDVVEPINEVVQLTVSTCAKELIPFMKFIKYYHYKGPFGNTEVFFNIIACSNNVPITPNVVNPNPGPLIAPSNIGEKFMPVPPGFREIIIKSSHTKESCHTCGAFEHIGHNELTISGHAFGRTVQPPLSPALHTDIPQHPVPNTVPPIASHSVVSFIPNFGSATQPVNSALGGITVPPVISSAATASMSSTDDVNGGRIRDYILHKSPFMHRHPQFSPFPRSFFFPNTSTAPLVTTTLPKFAPTTQLQPQSPQENSVDRHTNSVERHTIKTKGKKNKNKVEVRSEYNLRSSTKKSEYNLRSSTKKK